MAVLFTPLFSFILHNGMHVIDFSQSPFVVKQYRVLPLYATLVLLLFSPCFLLSFTGNLMPVLFFYPFSVRRTNAMYVVNVVIFSRSNSTVVPLLPTLMWLLFSPCFPLSTYWEWELSFFFFTFILFIVLVSVLHLAHSSLATRNQLLLSLVLSSFCPSFSCHTPLFLLVIVIMPRVTQPQIPYGAICKKTTKKTKQNKKTVSDPLLLLKLRVYSLSTSARRGRGTRHLRTLLIEGVCVSARDEEHFFFFFSPSRLRIKRRK